MPTDEPNSVPPAETAAPPLRQRLMDRISRVIEWAGKSRGRMLLVSSVGLASLTCLFVAWSMLARFAVTPEPKYDLEMALAALDDERFEDARAVIGALQHEPSSQETIGGALFVLGAAKAHEAEAEWSAERRRAMYLVAARYMQKAQSLGVPSDREGQLLFMLGVSLVKAGQAQAGIEFLNDALQFEGLPLLEIHRMLVTAHMQTADPDIDQALHHVDRVLADASLTDEELGRSLATQAELLLRMSRTSEARAAINKLNGRQSELANFHLFAGRLDVKEAEQLSHDESQRTTLLDSAAAHFGRVLAAGAVNDKNARQARYMSARVIELRGDAVKAIEIYDQLGKTYGDAPEGFAAQLSEAELELSRGNYDGAVEGFRRVLETIADPALFVNPLISLTDLRKRMLIAYQQFIDGDEFQNALGLVEQLVPVFSHLERIELRGRTHAAWGQSLALNALTEDQWGANELGRESRFHLRAAGRAFEDLARLRKSTRTFTDDLMAAAENYFNGQSYSHAIRLIEEYLQHEARRHNAKALLLLGEARLARSDPEGAVSALSECIEMYPRDEAVYQARLVRARAHQQMGQYELAEQLLLTNLWGDDLTPNSLQWRHSLFALGRLLYDAGRFDEAIPYLDQAVRRYEDGEEFLLAKYTIARANQKAADIHAQRLREAKTPNEQQKNRDEMTRRFEQALKTFEEVQRVLTLNALGEGNDLHHTLLRNCYMMKGSVLFELKRYEEARQAFSDIVTYYQGEPYVLEAFVQVANCWRRLNEPVKARATMQSAVLALSRLPEDIDFRMYTNFSRQQWEMMLDEMKQW